MKNIERGNRLKDCRTTLNKTLKELGAAHQVSTGSLSNWESGVSAITEKNVHKIISLLGEEGLICSKEWLLEGTGEAPYLYATPSPQKDIPADPFDLTAQFLFVKEIESFKKMHPKMLITLVRDDSMWPFLKAGDHVGGPILKKADYKRLEGSVCIVEINEGEFLIRQFFLKEQILLLSSNPQAQNHFMLLDKDPLTIAPVTFMRRFWD